MPPPSKLLIFSIEVAQSTWKKAGVSSTARVGFNATMMMSCSCTLPEWCPHREVVISNGLEVTAMHAWLQSHTDYRDKGVDILVPILPTTGLYAPTFLRPVGEDMVAVEDSNHGLSSVERFYGMIGPEQGIVDIRLMVADFINREVEATATPLLQCRRAAKHNMKAHRALDLLKSEMNDGIKRPSVRKDVFEYNASVFLGGLCPTCSSGENYEDVVPESVF